MSVIKASGAGEVSTGFYNGVIDQSLRFEDGDSARLSRTPDSDSNRKTFTISTWIKRGNLGTNDVIFGATASGYADFFRFNSNDELEIAVANNYQIGTNARFRDISNWYHILLAYDVTESTSTDRVKIYVNGTQQSLKVIYNAYPANQNYAFNSTTYHVIGSLQTAYSGYDFDGYMAEFNFIDGAALTPSSFGETKNGVWIPKKLSGLTYGTNGFRLTFSDRSSASALGTDSSGNGNNYATSGLADIDQSQDSPEVNFATLNPLTGSTEQVFSEGNLRTLASSSGANFASSRSTIGVKSGKWYAEFRLDVVQLGTGGQDNGVFVGTGTKEYPRDSSNQNGTDNGQTILYTANSSSSGRGIYVGSTLFDSGLDAHAAGDIIGIEMNVDDNEVTFYKNGTKQGNTRQAGVTTVDGGFFYFYTYVRDQSANTRITANFGQDGSFSNQRGFGTNSDDNGIGQFVYAPSSGYLALCGVNLPDTGFNADEDNQPTDFHNVVTYSGTGNTTQNITGVGFQPDWVWIKNRNTTVNHYILDSTRGLNYLSSNTTSAQSSSANRFNSFDSDGFQVEHSGGGNGFTNGSGQTYVAWNWKINGGTTTTDTTGSQDSILQTNQTLGMTIGLNDATSSNYTFAHGLGATPEFFMYRNKDSSDNWVYWHTGMGSAGVSLMYLNNTGGRSATGANWITQLDSSLIGISPLRATGSSGTHLFWAFRSIEGFSKFGNYEGNASTDGPFIYTGFRPSLIWIKNYDTGNTDHHIYDDARHKSSNTGNPRELHLITNSTDDDQDLYDVDFLSNGFKIRHGDVNNINAGDTYIYWAWAHNPFKFSNAF